MLSPLGLEGGEGTYKCPFMRIAFANAIKHDYEAAGPIEEEGRVTLFDQGWDGEAVFTSTLSVSKGLQVTQCFQKWCH